MTAEPTSPKPTPEVQDNTKLKVPTGDLPAASEGTTTRSRWATRKMTVRSGRSKRLSLLNRRHQHRRTLSNEKNNGDVKGSPPSDRDTSRDVDDDDDDGEQKQRTLFMNLPLPPEFLTDEGLPINNYPRNKIRTAKYTPLSFIPKNLWFQFHNVANIFFLFLVILVVRFSLQTGCPTMI